MTDFKNGDYLFREYLSSVSGPFVYRVLRAITCESDRISLTTGVVTRGAIYATLTTSGASKLRLATDSEILAAKLMGL